MEKINVLVTGVGGGGVGHEVVKALRLAGRYWIVGVDLSPHSLGFFDVDEAYTVPPAFDPQYIDILLNICKCKQIKVLISGSEPELKVISINRKRLLDLGLFLPINSSKVIERGMDKWITMNFLKDHGFPVPETKIIRIAEEIPKEFLLPAVIKPAVGGGGSNNTFLVQNQEELDFSCRHLLYRGIDVLLQEYVGTPDDEYTVGVLNTLDGVFIGSIALRRVILSGLSNRIKVANLTTRKNLSPILAISSGISQGIIDDFPEVRRACEAIAKSFNSCGPLNIQGRFVSGKFYTFEINPRLSGTSYIRALMGFNETDLLIRYHLQGENLPQPIQYQFGEIVRGLREQVIDSSHCKKPWMLKRENGVKIN